MEALVLDGSGRQDRLFKSGELFEVYIAPPRMTGTNLLIHTTSEIDDLNEFLVRLSSMIKIQEEHGIVVDVGVVIGLSGYKFPYGVDLETGDVFPECTVPSTWDIFPKERS